MKIFLWPTVEQFPERGGVKEHLRQLVKCMTADPEITITRNPAEADLYHVESSWVLPHHFPKKPMVYVCHGGFLPTPLPQVRKNLEDADMIVSVADWLVERFFPEHKWKSVTIANGVDLRELEHYKRPTNPLGIIDYLVYGKEWEYYFDDVLEFAELLPHVQIVIAHNAPVNVMRINAYPNLHFIGNQLHGRMMEILNKATALLLTGSEVCPTMLLEAWGLRVPVIAKNIDGNVEIMQPFGDKVFGGLLYDNPSPKLVELVRRERQSLGDSGYRQVKALYQWPDLWKKYKVVYERVLESDDGI